MLLSIKSLINYLSKPKEAPTRPLTINERELIINTPFFSQLDRDALDKLLTSTNLVHCKKDELIYYIGDRADTLYFLLQGEVDLESPNENELAGQIMPGQLLGEIELIKNTPRRASARAKTKVTLFKIEGDQFKNLLSENKTLKKQLLSQSATRLTPAESAELICICMSVTRGQLQDLIDSGVSDLQSLSEKTGACTNCSSCKYRILDMLGEDVWQPARLKRVHTHNSYINSFQLRLINKSIDNFKPGQHVILQAKVDQVLLERPYTISDLPSKNALQITLKREPKGLFSQWLFALEEQEVEINISQPQGNFILNETPTSQALCFAGGVGITPFITYAKTLLASNNPKPMHLVYCALTDKDFILQEEFNAIAKDLSSFSVFYRATERYGLLSEEEIINQLNQFKEPEIYICGPEGFTKLIKQVLQKVNYDEKKIFIEQFIFQKQGG